MNPSDFLCKNKKTVVTVGLILVCVSIAFSACTTGKKAAEPPVEPQTEQSSDQETEPASEPEKEPQGESTEEAEPTEEPESTEVPEPTEEPEPVLTAEYELIYEGITIFNYGTNTTFFRYKDRYADLYMRRLQDDTGEYIELSLWSDQKKGWYTRDRDLINSYYTDDNHLFWSEGSEHLALGQKLCYYVVPIDGTVYLMRYCVETASNAVTMSYKVFGISTINWPDYFVGYEEPFDADSITVYLESNGVVDPAVAFPVDEMAAFADTVKSYMENGYLAASTLCGAFEFGDSADQDNPVSPYLYDIFPWIPEMVTEHSINTEDIHSAKRMLTALQKILPTDASVTMPDVAADGKYFITGDYYSDSDESYLTVRMREDGSYGGTLLIQNLINIDFAGHYDNGILTGARISDYPDDPFYEMEISFKDGRATVTLTVAYEEGYAKVGDTFTLDRNEKPEEFEYLKNAEDIPRE